MKLTVLFALLGVTFILSSCKEKEQHITKDPYGIEIRDNVTLRPVDPNDINFNRKPSQLNRCLPDAPMVPEAPPPPLPLSGRLGLWVAEIDPRTMRTLNAVASSPNDSFPLASTYKQAVLWATLREYDAGRLKATERFNVTKGNQSLGEFPYDGSNVRTLTERMIQRSDNTATDILHRRVGLKKVQELADYLGLCHTRIMMPTRDWWVMQTGLSETFNKNPEWFANLRDKREALALKIDQEAAEYRSDELQRKLDYYFDHKYNPEDDFKVHNLSTPYEFATLLAYQNMRSGLSRKSQKWQQEVLALGFGKTALRVTGAKNMQVFGGKGGNGWKILTYSGYFQTKDGRHVVYAFMQHQSAENYTMPNTRRAFAWINAAVDVVIGTQVPIGPKPELAQKP